MRKSVKIAVVGVALLALAGCVSPYARSLTDEQRAQYEEECREAKGTFNNNWPNLPVCDIRFTYPREIVGEGDGDNGQRR